MKKRVLGLTMAMVTAISMTGCGGGGTTATTAAAKDTTAAAAAEQNCNWQRLGPVRFKTRDKPC